MILAELLRDSPVHGNLEKRSRVDNALRDIENDMSLSTPPLSAGSLGKRPRKKSSSEEDDTESKISEEAPAHAPAGLIEDPDFLMDTSLLDPEGGETGYFGREAPVHWFHSLQERLKASGSEESRLTDQSLDAIMEGDDVSTRPPSDQPRRILRSDHYIKTYFYLDSNDIDISAHDTHVMPPLETFSRLFKAFQMAAHNPFRLLSDTFEAQARTYYTALKSGSMLTVCPKWKACLNLVFAIGARYTYLVEDDSQKEGRE